MLSRLKDVKDSKDVASPSIVEEPPKTDVVEAPSTPAPEAPVESPITAPEEPQVEPESQPDEATRLAQFCKDQVQIEDVPQPSRFKVRGVCKKCGFQSYELTRANAESVISFHAMKHWYDSNGK